MSHLWKPLDIAAFLKSLMRFLPWVGNIAATFSLAIGLSSCDFFGGAPINRQGGLKLKKERAFKIAVESELLSFDPLSFNSLGESFVKSLLNDSLLRIENKKFISDFDIEFKVLKNKLAFENLGPELKKRVAEKLAEIKENTLWSSVARDFSFSCGSSDPEAKTVTEVCNLNYHKEENFISSLLSLLPLLRFSGGSFGPYKIEKHEKGFSLLLKKNSEWGQGELDSLFKKILIVKVKKSQDALALLEQEKVDFFFSTQALKKEEVLNLESSTKAVVLNSSKKLEINLYALKKAALKIYCKNKGLIYKSLSPWEEQKNSCRVRNIISQRDLEVLSNTPLVYKIFDVLGVEYKKQTGKSIAYKKLSALKLSEALKKKEFDLYLSQDVLDPKVPVSSLSFHSEGKFNTLGTSDKTLDLLFEEQSKSKDLKSFFAWDQKIKKRLKEVETIVFKYQYPYFFRGVYLKSSIQGKSKREALEFILNREEPIDLGDYRTFK